MNVVQLCGSSTGPCGYCNGKRASIVGKDTENCSKAYGLLMANSMSPKDYEALIHQGWRRSGIHIYKPDNWNSCCPALTIRLHTTKFSPSKSQKKVVNKLEKALNESLIGGDSNKPSRKQNATVIKQEVLEKLQGETYACLKSLLSSEHVTHLTPELCKYKLKTTKSNKGGTVTAVCTACAALAGKSKEMLHRDVLSQKLATALQSKNLSSVMSVAAHAPSGQVLITLSSDAVEDNTHRDHDEMSISTLHPINPIQEWLQTDTSPPYNLTITTLPAHESSLQPDVHKLYFQYQQAVHSDPDPLDPNAKHDNDEEEGEDWGVASPQYIQQCKSMLKQEYPLPDHAELMYSAFSGFYRFLVESPLRYDGTVGTVHQQYRIDGKLIAVGVVDLLPNGLSSVYAFYDPAQHVTAFGKYLSLKEIEYASPKYYYLGYYIESCPKMRYKAEYRPSELLCPSTYQWVDAAQAQEILLKESPQRHCCTLYKKGEEAQSNGANVNGDERQQMSTADVINQLRLDVGASTLVTLNMLHSGGQTVVRPLLEEYVKEVGVKMAPKFILKLV